MSAPHLISSDKEALLSWARRQRHEAPAPSAATTVRESLVLVRKDLSCHRADNNAHQENLDACLEDITSKMDRMMSTFENYEGSNPTNAVAGDHSALLGSTSFEALRAELGTLRETSKANKIRAEASQAKLESSLRALEVTLDTAGSPGIEKVIENPVASKVTSGPASDTRMNVETLSVSTRELAVAYVEAS
jgi:hypothetical protein